VQEGFHEGSFLVLLRRDSVIDFGELFAKRINEKFGGKIDPLGEIGGGKLL
jgi:hypothetical protein